MREQLVTKDALPAGKALDLDAIEKLAREAKERADAATPGPWEWDGRREENDPDMPGGVFVYHPQGSFLADTAICLSDTYEDDHLDLDFIAAARADVPALADRVLALIGRVRELEAAHNGIYRDGYAAGAADARKRCAEVAQAVADEMDGRGRRATRVGKAIAAAIKRGDA